MSTTEEESKVAPSAKCEFPRVVIVGAGISGLCLAIKLKQAGMSSVTLLEKSEEVGGTWLENTYPGCCCDVPSILYSYSFAPKYDWSRKFAPQTEILDYFRHCAQRFDIYRHVRFKTAVNSATFDEERAVWRISTDQGDELEADIFVSAVGQLNRPKLPEIEGRETFQGPAFHSARWNHDFDPTKRRIAVIGSGASAIQLIPKLAEQAERVLIFQRSANWISRRHDYRYPRPVQMAFRWIPGVAKLHRLWIYSLCESRILLYQRRSRLNLGFSGWLMRGMKQLAPDELHSAVIPQYPAGVKRVLVSNDYLECLHRDNVELVTERVSRISQDGVVVGERNVPVDAIVYATGFESSKFLYPMTIVGRDGVNLNETWQRRPRTYLGLACAGFPNFFMLYGPNTNLGHNSIIFMIECQVRYLIACLRKMQRQNLATIEVREDAVDDFDRGLQDQLKKKIWNGYVSSWYKTEAGDIINNWGGSTLAYYWQTRKPDWGHFELVPR